MNLFMIFFLALSQDAFAEANVKPCPTRLRAIIDMGSGTTKLNMGEVEICKGVTRLLRSIGEPVDRAVGLEASKNNKGEISYQAQEAALTALRELRDQAIQMARQTNFSEFELAVVGTHALRTARNRAALLKLVQDAGFSLRALTQDEEAEAGYEAVLASPLPQGCKKESLLVWDVGGGSTQLTRARKNRPTVVKFDLGAESFRKTILSRFKPTAVTGCPANAESPNPLGKENLAAARAMVSKVAQAKPNKLMTDVTCVIGIGGVHTKAVAAQIRKNWKSVHGCACGDAPGCSFTADGYLKKELECLAEDFALKSDCSAEIQGPYARTSASNLVMILGFMDQLQVERIFTMPINMGHHFILDGKRLKFKSVKVN